MSPLSSMLRLHLLGAVLACITAPAFACDLDGLDGPNHGGFGPWAAIAARHGSMPIDVPESPLSRRARIAEALAQREEAAGSRQPSQQPDTASGTASPDTAAAHSSSAAQR